MKTRVDMETCGGFFGDTWLNYLIEDERSLWSGGMGHSTEHTAYPVEGWLQISRVRLEIGLNGKKTVAEQIGAQIFIDGFGMACLGAPASD